jgi:hypothetical protein
MKEFLQLTWMDLALVAVVTLLMLALANKMHWNGD